MNRLFMPGPKRGSARTRLRFAMVQLGAQDGWHCAYCGTPLVEIGREADSCVMTPEGWESRGHALFPTLDHRTPIGQGGSDGLENLALACWPCNNEKRERAVEAWLAVASAAFHGRRQDAAIHRSSVLAHNLSTSHPQDGGQ